MKGLQTEPELENKLSWLMSRERSSLARHIGIEYKTLKRDQLVATMPVDERTRQPFGILHGGASVVLAESLASVGGWLNVDETKYDVVGVEINANHIRSIESGRVTGTATPVHVGRKVQVWEIKITNEQGKLICTSRCTLAVIEKRSK